jgi:hypothetical protein
MSKVASHHPRIPLPLTPLQKTSETYKNTPIHKSRTPTHLYTSICPPSFPPPSLFPPIPHSRSHPPNTHSLMSPPPPAPQARLSKRRPRPLQTLRRHNDTTPNIIPHNTTPAPSLRRYANNMSNTHLLPPQPRHAMQKLHSRIAS